MSTAAMSERSVPMLPARDLDATLAYYAHLGFATTARFPTEGYAMVQRGTLELHFFLHTELDPSTNYAGCYLRVPDADRLYVEYGDARIERLVAIADKPWGMREFAVVDLNGNLVRVGSPIKET